jgi:porin
MRDWQSQDRIVRASVLAPVAGLFLLSFFMAPTADAEEAGSDTGASKSSNQQADGLNGPEDLGNLLRHIQHRGTQRESLFAASPLTGLHDSSARAKQELYEAHGLKLGFLFAHAFQGLSESLPNQDDFGTSSQANFVGTWEVLDRGEATQGQFYLDIEGRWGYDTTAVTTLGADGLGSAIWTANPFIKYDPTFIVRNAYWHQGSREAGWSYRAGKITPDQILQTSAHISPFATFMPLASTGPFSIALADSGWGTAGAWYVNERMTLVGVVSDANADRLDRGDIAEGDLFKAVELQYKIAPRTSKAGYSKLTVWHTDGSKDGAAHNGSLGPSGWGVMGKLEQELSDDGRVIGILRYGKGFDDSALYDQQATAHVLLYDPPVFGDIQHDVVGVGLTWAKAGQNGLRSEYNAEIFYRFPMFPHVDTTLSYQSVFRPAYTKDIDQASVFTLRLRTSF